MTKQSGDTKRQRGQQGGSKSSKVNQQQQGTPEAEEFSRNQGDSTEQDYLDELGEEHLQHRRDRN